MKSPTNKNNKINSVTQTVANPIIQTSNSGSFDYGEIQRFLESNLKKADLSVDLVKIGASWDEFNFSSDDNEDDDGPNDRSDSEDPISDLHSALPIKEIDIFGLNPKNEPLVTTKCKVCNKIIKASAFTCHIENKHADLLVEFENELARDSFTNHGVMNGSHLDGYEIVATNNGIASNAVQRMYNNNNSVKNFFVSNGDQPSSNANSIRDRESLTNKTKHQQQPTTGLLKTEFRFDEETGKWTIPTSCHQLMLAISANGTQTLIHHQQANITNSASTGYKFIKGNYGGENLSSANHVQPAAKTLPPSPLSSNNSPSSSVKTEIDQGIIKVSTQNPQMLNMVSSSMATIALMPLTSIQSSNSSSSINLVSSSPSGGKPSTIVIDNFAVPLGPAPKPKKKVKLSKHQHQQNSVIQSSCEEIFGQNILSADDKKTASAVYVPSSSSSQILILGAKSHQQLMSTIDIDANGKPKKKFILCKNREYNPEEHCGVQLTDMNKPCTRSLTCRSHSISLRRSVPGRSKPFDQLMREYKQVRGIIDIRRDRRRKSSISVSSLTSPSLVSVVSSASSSLSPSLVLNQSSLKDARRQHQLMDNLDKQQSLETMTNDEESCFSSVFNLRSNKRSRLRELLKKKLKRRIRRILLSEYDRCSISFSSSFFNGDTEDYYPRPAAVKSNSIRPFTHVSNDISIIQYCQSTKSTFSFNSIRYDKKTHPLLVGLDLDDCPKENFHFHHHSNNNSDKVNTKASMLTANNFQTHGAIKKKLKETMINVQDRSTLLAAVQQQKPIKTTSKKNRKLLTIQSSGDSNSLLNDVCDKYSQKNSFGQINKKSIKILSQQKPMDNIVVDSSLSTTTMVVDNLFRSNQNLNSNKNSNNVNQAGSDQIPVGLISETTSASINQLQQQAVLNRVFSSAATPQQTQINNKTTLNELLVAASMSNEKNQSNSGLVMDFNKKFIFKTAKIINQNTGSESSNLLIQQKQQPQQQQINNLLRASSNQITTSTATSNIALKNLTLNALLSNIASADQPPLAQTSIPNNAVEKSSSHNRSQIETLQSKLIVAKSGGQSTYSIVSLPDSLMLGQDSESRAFYVIGPGSSGTGTKIETLHGQQVLARKQSKNNRNSIETIAVQQQQSLSTQSNHFKTTNNKNQVLAPSGEAAETIETIYADLISSENHSDLMRSTTPKATTPMLVKKEYDFQQLDSGASVSTADSNGEALDDEIPDDIFELIEELENSRQDSQPNLAEIGNQVSDARIANNSQSQQPQSVLFSLNLNNHPNYQSLNQKASTFTLNPSGSLLTTVKSQKGLNLQAINQKQLLQQQQQQSSQEVILTSKRLSMTPNVAQHQQVVTLTGNKVSLNQCNLTANSNSLLLKGEDGKLTGTTGGGEIKTARFTAILNGSNDGIIINSSSSEILKTVNAAMISANAKRLSSAASLSPNQNKKPSIAITATNQQQQQAVTVQQKLLLQQQSSQQDKTEGRSSSTSSSIIVPFAYSSASGQFTPINNNQQISNASNSSSLSMSAQLKLQSQQQQQIAKNTAGTSVRAATAQPQQFAIPLTIQHANSAGTATTSANSNNQQQFQTILLPVTPQLQNIYIFQPASTPGNNSSSNGNSGGGDHASIAINVAPTPSVQQQTVSSSTETTNNVGDSTVNTNSSAKYRLRCGPAVTMSVQGSSLSTPVANNIATATETTNTTANKRFKATMKQ